MYKKAFKYRIYPTKQQEQALLKTLALCRELYNASLEERKEAYRMSKIPITYNQQANQLPEIKEIRPEYNDIHSQVLQDTLRRVDKAMQNFFRRVKAGEKAGYPRFKSFNRFGSFTYPQAGYSLAHDNRVCLSKIGSIKIKLHRPIEGKIKTCTIKKEIDHWYIVFSCEVADTEPLPENNEVVGIDLGVTHLATLSDGVVIDNPRHFRRSQKRLIKIQQKLAQCKKGSHRRSKVKKQLAKLHRKIKNQRKDFLHKESRKLVKAYGTVVFEKLQPSNMIHRPKPKQDEITGAYLPNGAAAKAGLNTSILDVGWYQFQQYCFYKAEEAGRDIVLVNPNHTSQICSGCGQVVKKPLSERWHSCDCGTELDRDYNAAINILRLGSSQRGATYVEASCF
ncbi:MAG: RNA-guided endonuclease InsQ/TnpB family protein [Ktedonobacteraceae bacterium]